MHGIRLLGLPTCLVSLLLIVAGCTKQRDATAPRTGKPKVVATFSVIGDLARNVAGDQVELVTLVGGDGDAHTFEPAPQDGVALAEADVIFENGIGFEGWLDKLFSSSQSKARRVVVSQGLSLLEADEGHTDKHEHGTKQGGDKQHKHDHEEHDPHIWHVVIVVVVIVIVVMGVLVVPVA